MFKIKWRKDETEVENKHCGIRSMLTKPDEIYVT